MTFEEFNGLVKALAEKYQQLSYKAEIGQWNTEFSSKYTIYMYPTGSSTEGITAMSSSPLLCLRRVEGQLIDMYAEVKEGGR